MASRVKQEQMEQFLSRELSKSGYGLEVITLHNGASMIQAIDPVTGDAFSVLGLTKTVPVSAYMGLLSIREGTGDRVATVFYKDWKQFHKRAVDTESIMRNGALKNYNHAEIDKMIKLKELELHVLGELGFLTYFQPKTDVLPAGLTTCRMNQVESEYSHLAGSSSHRRKAFENTKIIDKDGTVSAKRVAKKRKLPEEVQSVTGNLHFTPGPTGRAYLGFPKLSELVRQP